MTLPDGRDLGWLEFGDLEGWPVFGFHGTPGSRLQLAIDEPSVERAGVLLIAMDRPGYGLSTFQAGRRLVHWPRDVIELADHLNIDRFSVMGVSGGGPHATVCAALIPERVVSAAIVSGVGPLSDPRLANSMSGFNKVLTTLAREHAKVLTALFSIQAPLVRRYPAQAIKFMLKQLPPSDAEVMSQPDLQAMILRDAVKMSRTSGRAQAQDFELFVSDWGFALGSITVPVRLWHGDADKNVPIEHSQLMQRSIPDSVLHTYAGEGHFLVLKRLEEILTELKSVDGAESPPRPPGANDRGRS
jgi:pimeloyl-ACP methyl ester carboxylesterase